MPHCSQKNGSDGHIRGRHVTMLHSNGVGASDDTKHRPLKPLPHEKKTGRRDPGSCTGTTPGRTAPSAEGRRHAAATGSVLAADVCASHCHTLHGTCSHRHTAHRRGGGSRSRSRMRMAFPPAPRRSASCVAGAQSPPWGDGGTVRHCAAGKLRRRLNQRIPRVTQKKHTRKRTNSPTDGNVRAVLLWDARQI